MTEKQDLIINDSITIPEHELEITASRSGGPGGQHVNKTSSKITVRWNVPNSSALNQEEKERIVKKLESRLTTEGDLIVHNSESRSQQHNRKAALAQLKEEIIKGLIVPKKRKRKAVPQAVKEARLQMKKQRSMIKKLRSGHDY